MKVLQFEWILYCDIDMKNKNEVNQYLYDNYFLSCGIN